MSVRILENMKTSRLCTSRFLALAILMFILVGSSNGNDCPCKNKTLCKALNIPPRREIIYWSTDTRNWKHYVWNKRLTTLILFGQWDPEVMCYAHARNVRVTFAAFYPKDKLTNTAYRRQWIQDNLSKAKKRYADGLNFDPEYPVAKGSVEEKMLTELVKETANLFHKEIPGSQVTFDVAWSPKCIDKRCYDFQGIAEWSDFVMVMSYDERGQIFGPCVAGANSAFSTTFIGIQQYLDLGIPPEKIVLGLPWYGYDYTCLKLEGNICHIKHVPYQGVNCSDAAGRQQVYLNIMKVFIKKAIGGVKFDQPTLSPYLLYKDVKGAFHQLWYDDPHSLSLKYHYALHKLKLRGLAVWQVDCVDYSNDPVAQAQTKAMYDALLMA